MGVCLVWQALDTDEDRPRRDPWSPPPPYVACTCAPHHPQQGLQSPVGPLTLLLPPRAALGSDCKATGGPSGETRCVWQCARKRAQRVCEASVQGEVGRGCAAQAAWGRGAYLKSHPEGPVANQSPFLISPVQPGPGHPELYQICDGGKSRQLLSQLPFPLPCGPGWGLGGQL